MNRCISSTVSRAQVCRSHSSLSSFVHGMRLLRVPFICLLPLYTAAWARQSLPLHSKAVSFMSKSSAAEEIGSPQLKILGVCGGIGSGKSTACKILVSELKCAAHIGKSVKDAIIY